MDALGETVNQEQKNILTNLPPELHETVFGNKPACFIQFNSLTPDQENFIRGKGFEVLNSSYASGEVKNSVPTSWVVAKRTPAKDLLDSAKLHYFETQFPKLRERLQTMSKAIDTVSITEALRLLDGSPRVDQEYRSVQELNLEQPEIAILEGLLLGYPNEDIDYYIKTRYLGQTRHKDESPPPDSYQFVRAPRSI